MNCMIRATVWVKGAHSAQYVWAPVPQKTVVCRCAMREQPRLKSLRTEYLQSTLNRGEAIQVRASTDLLPESHRTCPRALVAKRGDVGIREKEGFKCPWFCEHRATREPKAVACTLGTLKTDCGKAFSLLRFFVAVGQRNEVPPRTVANSDKKYSSYKTRADVSSSNPASTPITAGSAPPKSPECERK